MTHATAGRLTQSRHAAKENSRKAAVPLKEELTQSRNAAKENSRKAERR